MKKLLFITVVILYTNASFGQCTPNTSISSPGIYPDEITNLPESFVGQPYFAQIDVLTPLDTSVSLSGINVNVTIDNIELTSDVADSDHSLILDQVENGVAIRMAVLYLLSKKVNNG